MAWSVGLPLQRSQADHLASGKAPHVTRRRTPESPRRTSQTPPCRPHPRTPREGLARWIPPIAKTLRRRPAVSDPPPPAFLSLSKPSACALSTVLRARLLPGPTPPTLALN